jgi:putative drug exporter of the RND superfamily
MFGALARMVVGSRRRAAVTVIVWLALAAVVPALVPKLADVENNESTNDPPASAESIAARTLIRDAFPDQRGTPAIVVFRDRGGLTPADLDAVRTVSQRLSGDARPAGVIGVVSVTTQPQARSTLVSADNTTTTVIVPIAGSPSDKAFGETVDAVRAVVGRGSGDLQIRVTGPAGIIRDTVKAFSSANLVLLFGTLTLVLVLLLLIYRAPLLALTPVIAVGVAIELTNAIGAALVKAGAFEVNSQAASIMTVLLFGVGTDYCLFIISRYREELGEQPDRSIAMRTAIERVGEPLISSAATVIFGLLILLFATLPALRGFGPFLALAVFVMLLAGLTLVPAMVLLVGRAAFWPSRLQRFGHAEERRHSFWARTASLVLAHPVKTVLASLAVLVILSTGLINYRESYNFLTGFRVATESKQGQDLLNQAFPPGELAPTTVLVDAGQPLSGHFADVDRVTAAIARIPGVRSVSGPTRPTGQPTTDVDQAAAGPGRNLVSASGDVARLTVVYADDPYKAPALDRTARLRTVARQAVAATSLSGGRVVVGGESATNVDLRSASRRDLSVVAPLTLLVIGLVLALLLRSLVAPLYLVATTVASLFATVGLTVFVLLTVLGDEGMGNRVTAYIFVFLVALGVDYNIYLMSRVRQEIRQRDFAGGLYTALARSGGVISSAGVILAGTFAVLMTQPIRELFQFGFAMAVGILLDTFLVRAMLVPAIVKLLGPKRWPSPLTAGASGVSGGAESAPQHHKQDERPAMSRPD